MKIAFSFVVGLCLSFFTRDVGAVLATCSNNDGCTSVDNSITCDASGGNTGNCQCNINYADVNNVCVLKSCTTASDDCGADTACTTDTSPKCSCVANYVEASPTACAKIVCSAASHSPCTDEDVNSHCVGTNCMCKDNFIGTDLADCTRKPCTEKSDCADTNSACGTDGCTCKATFSPDTTTGACGQTDCGSDAMACANADQNSHCDSTKCVCKKNFVNTDVAVCTRISCSQESDCTETNTYCKTGTDAGCNCYATMSADSTTGACTTHTACDISAASATIESTCGGANTVCEVDTDSYKCFCKAGYAPSTDTGACAQIECTSSNVATTCDDDTTYQCGSDGKCACKDTFQASGSKCKKKCSATSDCDSNAACVNSVCECNVNYDGNGETCTQLTCSGATTTNCHPNSQCSSDKCACASGFVADGTSCKKSCTADSGCATNGICVSEKCECKATFVGDGANTCTSVACTASTDCTLENSSCNTTSNACKCDDGFEFGATTIACVETTTNATTNATTTAGAGAVAFNFSFMAASFLMAIFVNKM